MANANLLVALGQLERADLMRLIQTHAALSPFARSVASSALAFVAEEDYRRWRDLAREALAALAETDRGRAVLAEVGLSGLSADSHNG